MTQAVLQTGRAPSRDHDSVDRIEDRQMNCDRLLLSTMQAAISLIGFGFTIYQIFSKAAAKTGITAADPMARRVGASLLALGLILLSGGLWAYLHEMSELRARRAELVSRGLLPTARRAPSPVFLVASLLLLVSLGTMATIVVKLSL